jgi:hypothetical protein
MSARVVDRDNGYSRVLKNVRSLEVRKGVSVGVNEEPHAGSRGMTNAQIGAIHEFGLGKNPQRSFLRAWVDQNQRGWVSWLRERVRRWLLGNEAWAEDFGQYVVDGVRARMRLGIPPPLQDATVKRKHGGSTPLIDTEQLINAVEYQVDR